MAIRATCMMCRRSFELPPEAAVPGRACQYCGGELAIARTQSATPVVAARRDPIMGNCPICDMQARFEVGERLVLCGRCGTEIVEPEGPGCPARLAPPPATSKRPPIAVPCAHCGGRGRMAVEELSPFVKCEQCNRSLTAAYLPLEKWADVRALAQPGSLAETLLLVLRARWNNGTVSAGEVLRHVEGLRLVMRWLQTKPEERQSDFPLPVGATAETLKYFVLRVDKAEIQSQSSDRVILSVPTKREEPRESETKFRRPGEEEEEKSRPSMIVSIGALAAGSVFGFLAKGPDGATGALAAERLAEVKQMIAAAAPRATFRFLAYRFIFGEWMKPSTMIFVAPSIVDRELHRLGVPDGRIRALQERLSG